MRWLAILAIFGYRVLIRPFYRRVCLYDESCSAYAIRALREVGFVRGTSRIRARLRACRMPAGACFVIGADGAPRLISATSHTGAAVPPGALAVLTREAERASQHVGHAGDAATAPRRHDHGAR